MFKCFDVALKESFISPAISPTAARFCLLSSRKIAKRRRFASALKSRSNSFSSIFTTIPYHTRAYSPIYHKGTSALIFKEHSDYKDQPQEFFHFTNAEYRKVKLVAPQGYFRFSMTVYRQENLVAHELDNDGQTVRVGVTMANISILEAICKALECQPRRYFGV